MNTYSNVEARNDNLVAAPAPCLWSWYHCEQRKMHIDLYGPKNIIKLSNDEKLRHQLYGYGTIVSGAKCTLN